MHGASTQVVDAQGFALLCVDTGQGCDVRSAIDVDIVSWHSIGYVLPAFEGHVLAQINGRGNDLFTIFHLLGSIVRAVQVIVDAISIDFVGSRYDQIV